MSLVPMPHPRLRKLLEKFVHRTWCNWMGYQFECGVFMPDGSWVMPSQMVKRWQRQIKTDYDKLPEHEKESDIEIAIDVFSIVDQFMVHGPSDARS